MTKKLTLRPLGQRLGVIIWLALSIQSLFAQTCGPDCRALNLSITSTVDDEFHSKVLWADLIPNFQCAGPVSYELQTIGGATVARGSSDDVGNESYLFIENPCRFLRDGLMVIISNTLGSCMNRLTFKKGILNFSGHKEDLSCLDPRVTGPAAEDIPSPVMSCEGPLVPGWVADWTVLYDCVPGVQDTAKVIYREWEVFDKDGYRYSAYDTLVVFRLPALEGSHIFCPDRDTLYCGVGDPFGPYWLLEGNVAGSCDTIPFISVERKDGKISFSPVKFDRSCGLQLHLDTFKFSEGCEQAWRLDLEIKQECAGGPNEVACTVPAGSQALPLDASGSYWRCTFWVYDLDTLPPVVRCDYSHYASESILWPEGDGSTSNLTHCFATPGSPNDSENMPVVMVSTGGHDCAVLVALPGLCIAEDWTGIGQVKAQIEGIGTYLLNQVDTCADSFALYESHQKVELPLLEHPYQVIYEVTDLCHNLDTIYCYILVKDGAKPVAVADKSVTVSLSGKTSWVDAEVFDEGSYDNCAVNLLLARRVDWSTAGVDLCDSLDSLCNYHGEAIYRPQLETDKSINEIEAHYARTLKWLEEDGGPCTDLLLNAWHFGLIEAAYKDCTEGHLSRTDLVDLFRVSCPLELTGTFEDFGCTIPNDYNTLLDAAVELGGGWSRAIPFTCEDACESVTVEILVMDYWCNWSKNWTLVRVEDRSPVQVLQDVEEDIEITCRTFKQAHFINNGHSESLESVVDLASLGDSRAQGILDSVFGGYLKIWIDHDGHWIDSTGAQVDRSINLRDSVCLCEDKMKQIAIYDDHLGMIWVDSLYSECYYEGREVTLRQGIVSVNCAKNVQCQQSVWKDLDHCGEGYIYRKFEIWSSCSTLDSLHSPDTITRIQRIRIANNCTLNKAMFDIPGDVEIFACGIEYDPNGSGWVSGAADPELTGVPQYRFDDDCRIIGVAHEDKVFKIVGGDRACYKILRTWYFADWCEYGGQIIDGWWQNSSFVMDTCVQKIILIDTLAPVCLIAGPVEDGGIIEVADCDYDFFAELDVMDECGIIDYSYQIYKDQFVTHQGYGQLEAKTNDQVTIAAGELSEGAYTLRIRVTDQCQNEGFCTYSFTVETGKKPSPVCLSSLTVELTPEDLDNDGIMDTASAIIWANEFDVSSRAPCGATGDLKFFIEKLDGDTDFETLDTTVDRSYLAVGCADLGTQVVRMWVLSPTGSTDYCDVYLMVQANSAGCTIVDPLFSLVEGTILTTDGEGVKDVTVNGAVKDMNVESPSTDQDGYYQMMFGMGEEITITPFKDGNDAAGVTTADLLLLANHISNASPITDPYIRIAGNVNFDKVINAFDLLLMRNVILRNVQEWPDGTSWRFIPSDYSFQSTSPEAEDFPQSISLLLNEENMRADFVGLKIGDLDLDRPTQGAGRSGDGLILELEDVSFQASEQVIVRPAFQKEVTLMGLQLEWHFDPSILEFERVDLAEKSFVTEENFGLKYTDEGIIYFSWAQAEQKQLIVAGESLFSLRFRSKSAASPSEVLSLQGERLSATAYPETSESQAVALRFNQGISLDVGQNIPNPWRGQTIIPVTSSEAEDFTLVVTDLSGKSIINRKIHGIAGKQDIELNSSELSAPGVYYYTIIRSNSTTTRKMILLR